MLIRLLVSRSIALLLVIAVSGCASRHNSDAQSTVRTRAAFDFSCDAHQIKLTELDQTRGWPKKTTQVGAEGCGQKAVYIYLVSTDTWVANSSLSAETIEQEEEYQRRLEQQQQQQQQQQRQQQQQQQQQRTGY